MTQDLGMINDGYEIWIIWDMNYDEILMVRYELYNFSFFSSHFIIFTKIDKLFSQAIQERGSTPFQVCSIVDLEGMTSKTAQRTSIDMIKVLVFLLLVVAFDINLLTSKNLHK